MARGQSERGAEDGSGVRPDPRGPDDVPVLPERAAEDRDEAWGDAPASRAEDWYRRERPPHHE